MIVSATEAGKVLHRRSEAEVAEQVRAEITRLARERFAGIQEYIEDDALAAGQAEYLATWPFRSGDYPWLTALAKLAIEHGLAPELAGKPCVCAKGRKRE